MLLPKCALRALLVAMSLVLCFGLANSLGEEPQWQIGLARVRITPEQSMPMCGYGPRVSDGVLDDLYAKAMAIQSADEHRAVLVSADLLFFRRDVAEAVAGRIMEKTGLARAEILLDASHTHSGPVAGMNADLDSFEVAAEHRPRVAAFTQKLEEQLCELAVAAIRDLQPARMRFGTGRAEFVMNRRLRGKDGITMAPNPDGPVDRSVPVLRVDAADGRLRAMVFGCACHPVTLDGNNRKISGDYAGFAQAALEQRHPGAQAMFILGCAGDANSHPRGTAEMARKQGDQLAAEVTRVAAAPMQSIRGPLRTELEWIELPLAHEQSRDQLEAVAAGRSVWHARNAKGMLEALASGNPLPRAYRAPLAVWQFGEDLTLVGLSGEAVSAYAARITQLLGPQGLWISACSNESFGYLPTAQILEEGGHESMCLTLDIGLFTPQVEEVVLDNVRRLALKAGRQ